MKIAARIDPGRVSTGGAMNLDRNHWSQDLTTDGFVLLASTLHPTSSHAVVQITVHSIALTRL